MSKFQIIRRPASSNHHMTNSLDCNPNPYKQNGHRDDQRVKKRRSSKKSPGSKKYKEDKQHMYTETSMPNVIHDNFNFKLDPINVGYNKENFNQELKSTMLDV